MSLPQSTHKRVKHAKPSAKPSTSVKGKVGETFKSTEYVGDSSSDEEATGGAKQRTAADVGKKQKGSRKSKSSAEKAGKRREAVNGASMAVGKLGAAGSPAAKPKARTAVDPKKQRNAAPPESDSESDGETAGVAGLNGRVEAVRQSTGSSDESSSSEYESVDEIKPRLTHQVNGHEAAAAPAPTLSSEAEDSSGAETDEVESPKTGQVKVDGNTNIDHAMRDVEFESSSRSDEESVDERLVNPVISSSAADKGAESESGEEEDSDSDAEDSAVEGKGDSDTSEVESSAEGDTPAKTTSSHNDAPPGTPPTAVVAKATEKVVPYRAPTGFVAATMAPEDASGTSEMFRPS